MGPTHTPDVAIVGGGIAGSSLAITLRRQNIPVHLIERAREFRDRIRGETIHPWGVTYLRSLDLLELAEKGANAQRQEYWQTIRDREVQEPSRWADHFPEAPFGLGFNHVELQEVFLAEAERLGAVIWRPAEVAFSRDTKRHPELRVSGPKGKAVLRPRLVVGADGANTATRQWLGGELATDPVHHALGGVLVQGLGLTTDRIHQAFFEGGFAFVSPQSGDRARVYLVTALDDAGDLQRQPNTGERIVDRFVDAVPDGYLNRDWTIIGPAGFFPNATGSVSVPHTTDVVLIGDASGKNDPSQGHGLSLVLHDVAVLSEMLADNEWSTVPDIFHARKAEVFETLRQHAHWNERQATETGAEIDALRERIRRSREIDPSAAGFAGIFATGPMGLRATPEARKMFLGEDLIGQAS